MKRCGIAVAVAGLLLFSGTASAAEQTKNDGHSDGHGTPQVQQTPDMKMNDANSHNMTPEEHKNMDSMKMGSNDHNMTPEEHMNMDNSHDMKGMTHDGQSSGGGHSSHGSSKEVVETPPNIPVLSTFGGIMLAFILYGAWNKWLRKKEGAHA